MKGHTYLNIHIKLYKQPKFILWIIKIAPNKKMLEILNT